jgi:hypothetical protein
MLTVRRQIHKGNLKVTANALKLEEAMRHPFEKKEEIKEEVEDEDNESWNVFDDDDTVSIESEDSELAVSILPSFRFLLSI